MHLTSTVRPTVHARRTEHTTQHTYAHRLWDGRMAAQACQSDLGFKPEPFGHTGPHARPWHNDAAPMQINFSFWTSLVQGGVSGCEAVHSLVVNFTRNTNTQASFQHDRDSFTGFRARWSRSSLCRGWVGQHTLPHQRSDCFHAAPHDVFSFCSA